MSSAWRSGLLAVFVSAALIVSAAVPAAYSGVNDLESSLKSTQISGEGGESSTLKVPTLEEHNDNLAYVKGLYKELLGRDLDIDGEATWVGGLDLRAYTREEVRQNVLNSPEYQKLKASAASSFPKTGTVVDTEIGLNVRTGAWGTIIGGLMDGDRVTIVGEDGDWYKIDYNGRTAYVYKQYISAGGAAPADNSQNQAPPAADDPAPAPSNNASSGARDSNGALDVPLMGQPDGYTCGPTSLAMALKYLGIDKSIRPELVGMCKTTTDGTCAGNLLSAAKQAGASGSYMKESCSIDWLKQVTDAGNPVVANVRGMAWTGGHYLVVTGVSDGKVYINDPAWGPNNEKGHSGNKLVMDINTFSSLWSGRSNRATVIAK